MRTLAISDDWTHLIDRHGKQHVVQRGCTYPPGVAAPPPCNPDAIDAIETWIAEGFTYGGDAEELADAACAVFDLAEYELDGGSEHLAASLIASNADIGGKPAMTRLDRIEKLIEMNRTARSVADITIAGDALAYEVAPLLPLLRFWLEAEDQYEREKGLENTPATTLRKCLAADEALRAALRDSGGGR